MERFYEALDQVERLEYAALTGGAAWKGGAGFEFPCPFRFAALPAIHRREIAAILRRANPDGKGEDVAKRQAAMLANYVNLDDESPFPTIPRRGRFIEKMLGLAMLDDWDDPRVKSRARRMLSYLWSPLHDYRRALDDHRTRFGNRQELRAFAVSLKRRRSRIAKRRDELTRELHAYFEDLGFFFAGVRRPFALNGNDPDARANRIKAARWLCETFHLEWACVDYPVVPDSNNHLHRVAETLIHTERGFTIRGLEDFDQAVTLTAPPPLTTGGRPAMEARRVCALALKDLFDRMHLCEPGNPEIPASRCEFIVAGVRIVEGKPIKDVRRSLGKLFEEIGAS